MVFIDDVAYSLFSISFAGFMLLYATASAYLAYRKKHKNLSECLKSAAIPILLIGIYMLAMGLWGQFTWPLPGSYNILFYDPMVSFGIVLMAFYLSVKFDAKLEYTGFLALMVGVMVIGYGIFGYNIGLTKVPSALLGMYALYGLSGIFSYPVLLMADRFSGSKRMGMEWHALLYIFLILLLLASLLSAYTAFSAVPAHLLNPP